MAQYRKKPIVIDAIQWTGKNFDDIIMFSQNTIYWEFNKDQNINILEIQTLEGIMQADPGDYIIRGVKGEYYPCKPDIFEMTYESVNN